MNPRQRIGRHEASKAGTEVAFAEVIQPDLRVAFIAGELVMVLGKNPGISVISTLTLALGIGATTVIAASSIVFC